MTGEVILNREPCNYGYGKSKCKDKRTCNRYAFLTRYGDYIIFNRCPTHQIIFGDASTQLGFANAFAGRFHITSKSQSNFDVYLDYTYGFDGFLREINTEEYAVYEVMGL